MILNATQTYTWTLDELEDAVVTAALHSYAASAQSGCEIAKAILATRSGVPPSPSGAKLGPGMAAYVPAFLTTASGCETAKTVEPQPEPPPAVRKGDPTPAQIAEAQKMGMWGAQGTIGAVHLGKDDGRK